MPSLFVQGRWNVRACMVWKKSIRMTQRRFVITTSLLCREKLKMCSLPRRSANGDIRGCVDYHSILFAGPKRSAGSKHFAIRRCLDASVLCQDSSGVRLKEQHRTLPSRHQVRAESRLKSQRSTVARRYVRHMTVVHFRLIESTVVKQAAIADILVVHASQDPIVTYCSRFA